MSITLYSVRLNRDAKLTVFYAQHLFDFRKIYPIPYDPIFFILS